MTKTKQYTYTAMLLALGLILPPVIRMIPNGGVLFSPMHISPLLAGLTIGYVPGVIVGILCPILNNVLYGMPQGSSLIGMCFELPTYGLVVGILMYVFRAKNISLRVYISLICAMLVGRIVGGVVQAIVLGTTNYSFQMWISSYFIATAPAIVIHLIVLPAVYFALYKARLIERK